MDVATYCTRRAFMPAVIVGSFGAPMIWAALMLDGNWSIAWWCVPMTGAALRILALLFVAIGLAIFGLPAVWLFRRFLRQPWMILIAAVWGGLAGQIVASVVLGEPFDLKFNRLGFLFVLYGCVTGIAWFSYFQRAAKAEDEKDSEGQV